jgi:hypothetical protein
VVGDHRQVRAAEALQRHRQIAAGAGERLRGVEALVEGPAAGPKARRLGGSLTPFGAPQRAGEAPAGLDVDPHPEQRGRGPGQDLGQAHRSLDVAARHGVRAPRALEEDHGLQQVRLHPRPGRRTLDVRPVTLHAPGGGGHASGAVGVEHVAVTGGRAGLELLLPPGFPGERVILDQGGAEVGRVVAAAEQHETRQGDAGDEQADE